MKNLRKTLSAILAAAVIFCTAATPVSAFDPPEEGTYIGWEHTPKGWTYTFIDFYEPYCEIDGVLYDFDGGICTGRHNGYVSYGEVKMYYSDGLPYTGWTKNKKGERKYFLDGCSVKGEMPIGKNVYTFDGNGVLTGKKPALFTAVPDGKVCEGDKTINFTVKFLGEGVYDMIPPSKLERLNALGEWVDCRGEGVEYITCDCLYTFDSEGDFLGEKKFEEKTSFNPEEYIGAKLTAGYYRVTFYASGENDGGKAYSVFEVLPPAEVKMSEDIYAAAKGAETEVRAYIKINSESLAGKDISVKAEKKTALGWETAVKEFTLDKNAACDAESADGTLSADFSLPPETGYYRTVITVGGKEFETRFKIETR
ncbi:MAG: hypothetical protein NC253_06675 [Ruminococcus sp.]|nr:hypothetical protein [Ruminococcus sp.]MCM1380985.1 hypothetical protein [Muribaculaceae bacterium]MCM1479118.1 hypothetical protein [Muribaculaceae bacterium]